MGFYLSQAFRSLPEVFARNMLLPNGKEVLQADTDCSGSTTKQMLVTQG